MCLEVSAETVQNESGINDSASPDSSVIGNFCIYMLCEIIVLKFAVKNMV